MIPAMRHAAATLLAHLDGDQADTARRRFDDEAARRWIEYRPRPRPGVSLATLDPAARKAAHRLLASALSTAAFAQAAAIMALEEVLDHTEAVAGTGAATTTGSWCSATRRRTAGGAGGSRDTTSR